VPGRTHDPIDAADVYLTDEVFLYRVAGVGAGTVELEDCYRLDLVRVPLLDVRARGLRVVIFAPSEPRLGTET
jgi:hypothetical protein